MLYDIELIALMCSAIISAMITVTAKNLAVEIIYKFASLFSLIAVVGVAITSAHSYGLPTNVLTAVLALLIAIVIIEIILLIITIFFPTMLLAAGQKFKIFGGVND